MRFFLSFVSIGFLFTSLIGCSSLHEEAVRDFQGDSDFVPFRKERFGRVEKPSDSPLSRLARSFNDLLGPDMKLRSEEPSSLVADASGDWVLKEEEGLRVCQVSFLKGEGGHVVRSPECRGFIQQVVAWSFFGPELQLRDDQKTVVARLRFEKDQGLWSGSVISTGAFLELLRE
ncbi:MAG: AprI/Inh family metalloprotease inhibitor [Alphaproteobacteria bacterium]|nr:AprI/Inh family metalloprotease inhibitor [Alphaproteobacteria bacterium]